jgi:cell division protein FtsQ
MARKSGPTILQEELYPPGAARSRERETDAREEIDDARLVDLDVDEESPFLRGQKRVSARRSSLPKKAANGLLWGLVAAAVCCVFALGAAALYHYGEHSWRFRVDSSDNIEITGMQSVTKAQIMEVMGADIGRNIFFIPLAQQKVQLEQIPWVESASVMRFVPNRLKVEIHERTPVAFARVGPKMFLIDAGGALMELTPKRKYSFPVILGMNPGEPLSSRAPRMKVYGQMVQELDGGGGHYSQDLSEVDLSDLEDVKVRVNDPAGDVLVHLGSSDYLRRYKIYVTHAQGWRAQFQKLESLDLRYDNQIIVNPDANSVASHGNHDVARAAKPSALRPASAKNSAGTAMKSAALITRIPPAAAKDRALPKPAFELTEKKLEPKPASAASKKPMSKAKVKKSPAKVVGAGKKPAATAKSARTNRAPDAHRDGGAAVSTKPASGEPKPSPGIAKSQVSAGPGL